MFEWDDDLKIRGADLYLDSRRPRGTCFVSHAHSDHIATHGRAIATAATAALTEHRIGAQNVIELAFDKAGAPAWPAFELDGDTRLRLLPAGHVLGSAMIHVARPGGTLLYTGDFKLRESRTAERARAVPADVLVMESTFGQPFFRFPPWRQTADRLAGIVEDAFAAGRQPIVMGYSLGKAQEATRLLADAGFNVTQHGAVHALSGIYNRFGVDLGPYRRYNPADFHGPRALDLRERGVLVAPPNVARSGFSTRFKDPCRVVLTGWALLKGAHFRYGVEHALPLSDHADFDELLELIEIVRPKKIYAHHGYKEFVGHLRARGLDASPAKTEAQMSLFGD